MQPFFHSDRAKRAAVGAVMVAVAGSMGLTALVAEYPVLGADVAISRELQGGQSAWLLPAMWLVSSFGIPWVAFFLAVAAAALFYLLGCRREALYALVAPVAGLLNAELKLLVNRPRPPGTLVTVYENFAGASFPSGHVVYYVVFFGFIATTMIVMKGLPLAVRATVGSLSFALIMLVSFSRVYLGAHWATDVIGGYCVGFVMLAVVLYFYFRGLRSEPLTAGH